LPGHCQRLSRARIAEGADALSSSAGERPGVVGAVVLVAVPGAAQRRAVGRELAVAVVDRVRVLHVKGAGSGVEAAVIAAGAAFEEEAGHGTYVILAA